MCKLKTRADPVIVGALGMIKKGAEGEELMSISPLFWIFLLTLIES